MVPITLAPNVRLLETRHGSLFVLTTDNSVGRALLNYGEWTFGEIELVRKFLRPGDYVLDIGANIGTHAIPLAKAVGHEGQVIAFEPQPCIFELLKANTLVNGLSNLRCICAGCGAQTASIGLPDTDYGTNGDFGSMALGPLLKAPDQSSSNVRIPVMAIDDVFTLKALRLIKIDVEGMEIDVLRGAEQTIRRLRPILYIENEWPDPSEPVLRAVRDLGYRSFWHVEPLYNPKNFFGEQRNIFGVAHCINNLCIPVELTLEPVGLKEISSTSDHPRKTLLERALKLKAKAAMAHCARGFACIQAQAFDEALQSFDRALAEKPDHIEALICRGDVLQELQRLDEAFLSYKRASAIDPRNSECIRKRDDVLQKALAKRHEAEIRGRNTT